MSKLWKLYQTTASWDWEGWKKKREARNLYSIAKGLARGSSEATSRKNPKSRNFI